MLAMNLEKFGNDDLKRNLKKNSGRQGRTYINC